MTCFCAAHGFSERQLDNPIEAFPRSLALTDWKPAKGFRPWVWQGQLADGSEAWLLHASRTVGEGSGGGGHDVTEYFDTVRVRIPESVGFSTRLVVAPKGELGAVVGGYYRGAVMDRAVFPDGMQRLKLDSRALNKRYEIGISKRTDEASQIRLFTPDFVEWLATDAALSRLFTTHVLRRLLGDIAGTYFELIDGTLDTFSVTPSRLRPPETLDSLIASAARFAGRLRETSLEDESTRS